jgi:hypothetical protein
MNKPVPRHRRARNEQLANRPARVAARRSARASMFVEWNLKSAAIGGRRTSWPVTDSVSAPSLPIGIGHRYLCRLLLVHDVLACQGVATASGMLSESELADAVEACTYFELHDLAAVVAEIPLAASSPRSARIFDAEYRRRYATTDRVVDAILEHIASRPEDFPGHVDDAGGTDDTDDGPQSTWV